MRPDRSGLPTIAALLAGSAGLALAVNPGGVSKPNEESAAKVAVSPELAVLERFVGPWRFVENHLNPRGETVVSAHGTEEIAWTLDRHAVRRLYSSGEDPSVFRALGLLTWNAEARRYEGAWFDNKTTAGPTMIMGTWDESSRTMTFALAPLGADPAKPAYKVVERFVDDEHRVATTFRLAGGQIEKVLEVQYVRTVPCPAATAGMRIIGPDAPATKKD